MAIFGSSVFMWPIQILTTIPDYNLLETNWGCIKEMKITIKRLVGTACGVYIPHMSKVGEGKEYPVDHVKSEYKEV